jgi:hypothetical protein
MSKKQIPEMNLSTDMIGNLPRQVRDSHLTCINLLRRKQKMLTAGTSTKRIRLLCAWQQMQNASTSAGTSADRI